MQKTIETLLSEGFSEVGLTKVEIVRVPTITVPVFGGSGGKLTKFGGRLKFEYPSTDIKVTVGKRTTSFYLQKGSGIEGVKGLKSFKTSDLPEIKKFIEELLKDIHD